jgi:HEAT repeat protein
MKCMGFFAILALAVSLQDPARLIEELRSEEASKRETAERALRSLGLSAIPALEKVVQDDDPEVARRAIFLCRVIGWDRKVTPRLNAAVPGLADRLVLEGNPEAAKALVQALGAESIRLRHPELRREDLDPLIAEALRGASSDEDFKILCRAAEERRLPSAAPELVPLLRNRPSPVSRQAFLALLHVGNRAHFPALEELSREGGGQAQQDALFLLGRLGASEIAPRCLVLMKDPSAYVRSGARWALQDLGIGGRRGDLRALLRHENPMVRQDALIVARTLGVVEAVTEIIPLLKDEGSDVRLWAVMALAQLNPSQATSQIVPLLRDGSPQVRWVTAETLGEIGSKEAVSSLIEAFKDSDARVRKEAVDAVGKLKAAQAASALERMIDDGDPEVRSSAVEALAAARGRESIPTLLEILRSERSDEFRASAAQALASIGAVDGTPELLRLLESRFDRAAERALRAAGGLKLREALPAAVRALERSDSTVRSSALQMIGDLGAVEAEASVVARLADSDGYVRRAAAYCLCRLGSRKGVEMTLEQGASLLDLNLLRSPAALKALEESTVPVQFGATRLEVVERLARDHGWKADYSFSGEAQAWMKGPASAWLVEGKKRSVDVLRGLTDDRFAVVLDPGRIRIMTRIEAERFWTAWLAQK